MLLDDHPRNSSSVQRNSFSGARGMKRGDSYLFEIVDDLPMAPAPEFVVSPQSFHPTYWILSNLLRPSFASLLCSCFITRNIFMVEYCSTRLDWTLEDVPKSESESKSVLVLLYESDRCWEGTLQEYESVVIHQHTSRRRLSVQMERQHSMTGEAAASPRSEAEYSDGGLDGMSVWQKLNLLFSDLELIVFLMMAVLFGFATGAIDGYLFIYLDSLGELALAWSNKKWRWFWWCCMFLLKS